MSALGVIMLVVWFLATRRITMGRAKAQKEEIGEKRISALGLIALAGLVPVFIVIILQGILRDGIQTWLPSIVKEQFGLGESSSVLSVAILPALSMVSIVAASFVYRKIKNEIKTSFIMFLISFIATIPLVFGGVPAIVTILAASLISACMHGINLMLISFIPKAFMKYGMVSTFSGILNAFTYVGAALSTYGFAAIADRFNWNAVIISWCVIALSATLICLFKIKGWRGFLANTKN
jgi:OPA family glycerol-3-phosphate transporter-like MFS transporter